MKIYWKLEHEKLRQYVLDFVSISVVFGLGIHRHTNVWFNVTTFVHFDRRFYI